MSHSVQCGKVLEMGDEGGMDRISSLPDELLVQILSSVSTLAAAQTSILSTRWRYLFTMTSNLSFDDQEFDVTLSRRFKRFVYGVLGSHKKSSVEKFSLNLGRFQHDCLDFHEWISSAIMKKVHHLHLGIVTFHSNFISDCAFNCDTLVVLKLILYDVYLRVPGLVCLPSLTVLELYSITFDDDDSTKRFFDGCPQLQELTILSCDLNGHRGNPAYFSAKALQKLRISWCRGHIVIDAPNLMNLRYDCHSSSADLDVTSSLENPCCLERVALCFAPVIMYKLPQVVTDVITGARIVKELILKSRSFELLTRVKEDHMAYSMLQSLRFEFYSQNALKYVKFLLANSPQLEIVIFKKGLIDVDTEPEWPPNMALAPFSSNVKTIEVHHFGGSKSELLLLKYLLENAGALKRLIIYKLKTMKIEEEVEISKELMMFPKASTDFTIELETEKADKGDNN